jgi:hypothetical protein
LNKESQYLSRKVNLYRNCSSPATASNTDLLVAGALYKMATAVAEVDLLGPSALRLLETMTGAQLEEWLQDASNREAFSRILASSEAMRAVAASSTAMAAVNASDTALNALYASPLVVKYTHAGSAWSANPQILRNGAGLFVRLTQLDNSSGWGDNYTGYHYLRFDGGNVTMASTNNGLPYNFTQVNAKFGRQPVRRFDSQFGFYDYNRIELAWIPL